MKSAVLTPEFVTPDDLWRCGGKAVNLVELSSLGAAVPPWFVVSSEVFDEVIEEAGVREKIREVLQGVDDASPHLKGVSKKIRGWIEELEWPQWLREEVEQAFDEVLGGYALAAVRSSARDEDDAEFSFAGLHDSVLFVRGEGIVEAVSQVWSSAFTERALGYRLRSGLDAAGVGVAVIVQEMIDARTSGVVFTANPATEDVETVLINSLWGAGEGLVGEGFEADSYEIHKFTGEQEKTLAKKATELVFDADRGYGLKEVDVEATRKEASSLSRAMVDEIVTVARRVEDHYGRPQDMEFCIDREGRLHWLQTRAVTTVKERGPAAGQRLIWDNSNIIESYSGVTTPLTFSFIERSYTLVYQCFCEVMGVPPETVRRNMPVFENMLGLVRGEVYYNLLNWYRAISLFPGYQLNKEFMESMMGVDESLGSTDEDFEEATFLEKAADVKAVAKLVARSTKNFARIRSVAEEFEDHFEEHFQEWAKLDLSAMRPDELMHLYWDMDEKLVWNWRAPIINDFYVMIFYGMLAKLCETWCGDEEGTLQHDLICGEGGIATKEASDELIRLAKTARAEPAVRELIQNTPPDEVLEKLRDTPGSEKLLLDLDDYLEEYGYRSMNELKLEEPTMRDEPGFVFQMIRNYLGADESVLDLEARRERELAIRREAEERAFGALNPVRKVVFKRVLKGARMGVKNRENMRFKRTKIYGLSREVFLAVADTLVREGLLEDRDDIFYLTVSEIWGFVKGTAVTTNLKGLVALRKEEFLAYREDPQGSPDDRFATYGMVYHGNQFKRRRRDKVEAEEGVLTGIGCCSGEVEGPVKVIRTPGDDMNLNGEILVAERTDPGWVPLYPSVSAVLIERGSVLSHSAIVAREMGIPTIVGIEGLLDAVSTGDVVRMDGRAGTVEIVEAVEADGEGD